MLFDDISHKTTPCGYGSPRARGDKAHEVVTVGSPGPSGIPARDGSNGFLRDLPGDRALLSPSPCASERRLDASVEASGPHDFAVRVQHRSSAAPNSVHHIPSRVRDDRERPLVGRDGAIRKVFRLKREARYFCERGWTGDLRNRRGKSAGTPQNITTDRQGANRRSAGVPLYLARGQPGWIYYL